jgi:urease accessory protein
MAARAVSVTAPAVSVTTPGEGLAALALLADGRLPIGGHAHSGGIEAAAADGRVHDGLTLTAFLAGRLRTAGRVDAALAVAAWTWAGGDATPADAALLDVEGSARIASPALRTTARAQGRGLLRMARRSWPNATLDRLHTAHPIGPLLPVALGATAHAAGVAEPRAVATVAAWSAVSGPAWAAVRLLGLDPLDVAARLAGLTAAVDEEATTAAVWALHPGLLPEWIGDLPADGAPLTDIAAERHDTWEVRLFAS